MKPTLACAIAAAAFAAPGMTQGNDAFDPLLDGGALCGAPSGGPPLVMRALVLAKTETSPFLAVPSQPAHAELPRLYPNLGTLRLKAGTDSGRAQQWFDQGIRLSFAFNHAEAQRAFREAQKADPACALCFWGEALVLGPNVNVPMMPDANAPAPPASAWACFRAASAGTCASGIIGTLMLGPSTSASPQKHSAHFGSSFCAMRKARRASAWLKP